MLTSITRWGDSYALLSDNNTTVVLMIIGWVHKYSYDLVSNVGLIRSIIDFRSFQVYYLEIYVDL